MHMRDYTYGQPLRGSIVASYSSKRTCSAPGCSTRLSIYNATEHCSLHDGLSPRPRLSPKRS